MDIWFVVRMRGLANITGCDREVKPSVDRNIVRVGDRNSLDAGTSQKGFQ